MDDRPAGLGLHASTPIESSASRLSTTVAHATDPTKVIWCSVAMLPFAIGWLARLYILPRHPELSPYVNRSFIPVFLPFLWTQLLGHVALVAIALVLRARGVRTASWLVHAEIQFWMICTSISLYTVGPLTTPFIILIVALPVIGSLLFEARPLRLGLITMAVGFALGVGLPVAGVVPYGPFVGTAPYVEGRINLAWVLSFGGPSVFATVFMLLIHTSLLQRLRDRQQELEHLSSTDVLTGLANRSVFYARLREEMARARRHKHGLCVLFIDADNFKAINDDFGHPTGDAVLVEVGRKVRDTLRQGDIAARWGGEEFAILLSHTAIAEARLVADRLLVLSRTVRAGEGAMGRKLTVSIGLAQLRPGETAEELISRADAALYGAKHEGRDRVTVAQEPAELRAAP
ncbi:MAG: GGDEF domain-containing protein [Deltaproteobacteria bacterium]|nr:GGDEF domain-containing protein [Deltaproteobacteria bacterium]